MTYTEVEIQKLIKLKEEGVSWNVIGIALGRNPKTVKQYYRRNKMLFGLPPKPKASKRKVSGFCALQVKDIIRTEPRVTVRDFRAMLLDRNVDEQAIPSKTTIAEFLREIGFERVKLKNKQFIREANVKKRFEFAKEGLAKGSGYWHRVIWSDETTVRSVPQGKMASEWVHKSVDRNNIPINPQIQHGGISVMFWGCISIFGKGPLVPLSGNMKGPKYISLLQEHLLSYKNEIEEEFDVDLLFMQDNAPCHKGKAVMDFLGDSDIETLNWPPQSPDLNPIENLWAIVKHRRQKKFGIPSNKSQLVEQTMQIWDEVEEDLVIALCDSIGNRLSECVDNEGKNTSY